jgi:hypothetical protein
MRSPARTVAVLLTFGLAAAQPAHPQAPALATPASQPAQLRAPEQVAKYRRVGMYDYGTPALGVSYSYRNTASDGTTLTLYLYARDSAGRTMSVDDELARSVRTFKADLEGFRGRGYDAYRILIERRDSVATTAGVLPGAIVKAELVIKGEQYQTYFYIYVIGDAFVKIRATVVSSKYDAGDIPSFVESVVRASVAR